MVICACLGGLITFCIIYINPNGIIKNTIEKNVKIEDTGIAESVEKIIDATVVVEKYKNDVLTDTGTGFVFKDNNGKAYIITNQHVIENASAIKVIYSNNKEVNAQLVGSDQYADIAVLEVDEKSILKVADIGSSTDMRVGDTVFTIGTPMGILYSGTATKGILSGKNRLVSVSTNGNDYDWIMNVMQTDAAVNPGNSGGPLCNINGEVIGINSLKFVQNTVEGIGFAIPIEDALEYANILIKNGKIARPYIGIEMIDASKTFKLLQAGVKIDSNITKGVVITKVEKGTPAEKAKLRVADVIIKVEEYKVENIAEFRYRLFKYNENETIELTIIRDGKEQVINVTLINS